MIDKPHCPRTGDPCPEGCADWLCLADRPSRAPEGLSAEERALLLKSRMVPYEDGKVGWLFRAATDDQLVATVERIVAKRELAARVAALREEADDLDLMWNRGHDNSAHPNSHLLRERADREEQGR